MSNPTVEPKQLKLIVKSKQLSQKF